MWLWLVACGQSPGEPAVAATGVEPVPVSTVVPAGPPDVYPAQPKVVAIGDLHGDVVRGISAFTLAGLADPAGHWVGGTTWLVQTGDVLDRGPNGKTMFAWMAQIEREAEAAGGKAIFLNGNHEVMNLHGDWRYVADQAEFADEAARIAWMQRGEGAAWVRSHQMTVQVGDTVFVHGGIDANWAELGIAGLNRAFAAALDAPKSKVLGDDGPLWNRVYLLAEPAVACAELTRALAKLGAKRMVVGHTRQDSGTIATRCEGALWGVDTGIAQHYGRNPSALILEGATVRALP